MKLRCGFNDDEKPTHNYVAVRLTNFELGLIMVSETTREKNSRGSLLT